MKLDLNCVKRGLTHYKDCWTADLCDGDINKYKHKHTIDSVDTMAVLEKFYRYSGTFPKQKTTVVLVTNKGNLVEIDTTGSYLLINKREQCLGDNVDSWAMALNDVTKTSDFLAQLAVFANKHAR